MHESTQRKNKLTAIYDELFPEFTRIFADPNRECALAIREHFPTPHAIATASITALTQARTGTRPSKEKLLRLQELARETIGTKDLVRQRAHVFEQTQLIRELKLISEHCKQLDAEITSIVENSREGKILTSMLVISSIQAGTIIASIGNIANFKKASELKSYFGWAPVLEETGTTLSRVRLTKGGSRIMRNTLFLIIGNAIRMDCEWARLYERLVPKKCRYDERTKSYRGKLKVIGRIAGQMIEMIYAFLKKDHETLSKVPPGQPPPEPMLYDPAIHQKHRKGEYRPLKRPLKRRKIIFLPPK